MSPVAPWRTVQGIRDAVVAQDARALSRHVDFPALRVSLRAQLNDHLVREAGIDAQSGLFGALALRVAGGLVDAAVEAMVTPVGLGAVMEGRKVWNNVIRDSVGAPPRPATEPWPSRNTGSSRFRASPPPCPTSRAGRWCSCSPARACAGA